MTQTLQMGVTVQFIEKQFVVEQAIVSANTTNNTNSTTQEPPTTASGIDANSILNAFVEESESIFNNTAPGNSTVEAAKNVSSIAVETTVTENLVTQPPITTQEPTTLITTITQSTRKPSTTSQTTTVQSSTGQSKTLAVSTSSINPVATVTHFIETVTTIVLDGLATLTLAYNAKRTIVFGQNVSAIENSVCHLSLIVFFTRVLKFPSKTIV